MTFHRDVRELGAQSRTGVVLVKAESCAGQLAVGAHITFRVPAALSTQEARVRAFRMLKREHPSENPMDWRVEE